MEGDKEERTRERDPLHLSGLKRMNGALGIDISRLAVRAIPGIPDLPEAQNRCSSPTHSTAWTKAGLSGCFYTAYDSVRISGKTSLLYRASIMGMRSSRMHGVLCLQGHQAWFNAVLTPSCNSQYYLNKRSFIFILYWGLQIT